MTRTLLDISDDMIALDDLLTESGGDVSDPEVEAAITKWFAEIQHDMDNKVDGYAALITEMEARAAIRKDEANRMLTMSRRDESSAKFLKARLKMVFEMHGVKKIETDRFRVGIARNGGKKPLAIDDVDPSSKVVPPKYTMVVPAAVGFNKDAIRTALDAGENLKFARYGERGTRLSIK